MPRELDLRGAVCEPRIRRPVYHDRIENDDGAVLHDTIALVEERRDLWG